MSRCVSHLALRRKAALAAMRLLPVAVAGLLVAACASMGRPEGGPRDMTPPAFVRSSPEPGALGVQGQKLSLWFDENVQLDDPSGKVIVSPSQLQQPVVTSNGRRVRVELRDTLLPNTTYTIDFGDAIQDLNEGNPLDGFALAFSTGPLIDSLSISGMVVEAATLEPAQGMLVGIHSEPMADTTLLKVPFERVTRTNQLGQFTLRNLREGSYRVFAVNDVNRDYRWDRSEDIAFLPQAVTPTARLVEVTDTLGGDSLATRMVTEFGPSDLLLEWFNENYSARYLTKHERPERRRLYIELAAPDADSLPRLSLLAADSSLLGPLAEPRAYITSTPGRDSLSVWLADTLLAASDTLLVGLDYRHTDTLDRLAWRTDTLRFIYRTPKPSKSEQKEREKQQKREVEKQQKRLALLAEARESGDTLTVDSISRLMALDSLPKIELLGLKVESSSPQELDKHLRLTSPTPLLALDSLAGVRLELMVDSVWTPLARRPQFVLPNPLDPTAIDIVAEWQPAMRYRLSVDSLAATDIFGLSNGPLHHEFDTRALEDYSALYVKLEGLPEAAPGAVVELLTSGDKPSKRARVDMASGMASLEYLLPGTYYMRMFVDTDSNRVWTPGSLSDSLPRLPEPVSYYPKKISLKKNWDLDVTWNIDATAVDLQKPEEIKKNKPKRSKWETQQGADGKRNDEEDDESQFDPFNPNGYGNNSFNGNRGFGSDSRTRF